MNAAGTELSYLDRDFFDCRHGYSDVKCWSIDLFWVVTLPDDLAHGPREPMVLTTPIEVEASQAGLSHVPGVGDHM